MANIKLTWLGIALLGSTAFFIPHAAKALNGPTSIDIDGGPFGDMSLVGGVAGYGYVQSGTADRENKGNSIAQTKPEGFELNSMMIQLSKKADPIGFTFQVAAFQAFTLGAGHPKEASLNHFPTGPVRNAYLTIAPLPDLKISAGHMGSLEGYESTFPWNNPTGMNTILYYVTNSNSRGVQAEYSTGPLDVTVLFGDGTDSGVFNYLQLAASYTFDANNVLNFSAGQALGVTGPHAYSYGGGTVGDGAELAQNFNIYSLWYSYTNGNLNLVPEVQYAYANPNHRYAASNPGSVIPKFTSNFGAALFGTYGFANTPYSLGGWVEYADSVGDSSNNYWFLAPRAQIIGVSLAPTWQYKDLYARLDTGYVHVLHGSYTGDGRTGAFGNSGHGKDQFVGMLEAGLVF